MFYFNFAITNPLPWKGKERFDYCSNYTLTTNKSLEFQFSKWPVYHIFNIRLDTNWIGSDHAGISFEIEILGVMLHINLYDHRHWDYENNTWET